MGCTLLRYLPLCLLTSIACLFSYVGLLNPGIDHPYRGSHYSTEMLQIDVPGLNVLGASALAPDILRASNAALSLDMTLNNLPKRRPMALQWGLADHRRGSVLGKRIDSGAQGRVAGYQSRNDIKASLMRDDEGMGGDVKEHQDDERLILSYTGDNLITVNGVLDLLWKHHYDSNGLAGCTDSVGRRANTEYNHYGQFIRGPCTDGSEINKCYESQVGFLS